MSVSWFLTQIKNCRHRKTYSKMAGSPESVTVPALPDLCRASYEECSEDFRCYFTALRRQSKLTTGLRARCSARRYLLVVPEARDTPCVVRQSLVVSRGHL